MNKTLVDDVSYPGVARIVYVNGLVQMEMFDDRSVYLRQEALNKATRISLKGDL